MLGRLSPLQARILAVAAGIDPPWALTGGGALAGFHLEHRTTRDLDLFWHGRPALGDLVRDVEQRLRGDGLTVATVVRAPTFHRFNVTSPDESCLVDLVADTSEVVEPARLLPTPDGLILVDTAYEIFVNKLCTLLGRSEIRDLIDLEALLEAGIDLDRALADAPRKDAGFSPLVLAWVLRSLPVGLLASRNGLSEAEGAELSAFRERLIDRLTANAPL